MNMTKDKANVASKTKHQPKIRNETRKIHTL